MDHSYDGCICAHLLIPTGGAGIRLGVFFAISPQQFPWSYKLKPHWVYHRGSTWTVEVCWSPSNGLFTPSSPSTMAVITWASIEVILLPIHIAKPAHWCEPQPHLHSVGNCIHAARNRSGILSKIHPCQVVLVLSTKHIDIMLTFSSGIVSSTTCDSVVIMYMSAAAQQGLIHANKPACARVRAEGCYRSKNTVT